MRECLPRAIRNRPEPRYNKGGAIAVVKSTESLNSWYRLLCSPLPPSAFLFLLTHPSRCYPCIRARNYLESGERGPSLVLLAPRELCDYVTYTRVCMLFWSAIWSNLVSLSRFPKRESIMSNPAELNETWWHSKVRILTKYARWNCCSDSAFSFCTFQRSHYCGILGFVYSFSTTHLRIWKIFGQLRFLKYANVRVYTEIWLAI